MYRVGVGDAHLGVRRSPCICCSACRYQEEHAERAIEYCDLDDLKPEYVAEIKQIMQRGRAFEGNTASVKAGKATKDTVDTGAGEGGAGVVETTEHSDHSQQYRVFDLQVRHNHCTVPISQRFPHSLTQRSASL